MSSRRARLTVIALLLACSAAARNSGSPAALPGFENASAELSWEKLFLAVPDPHRAEDEMKFLSAEPHPAGSLQDRKTADYVARKFREAGLDTSIVEYRVWMNYPIEVSVDIVAPASVHMHGPTPEPVDGDNVRERAHISPGFSGYSPSGDAEADIVYANYGRPEDFDKLHELGVDVRGKIVIIRYGEIFRGAKVFLAQERGAAAVILYSDPMDDGFFKGDAYPNGPWRPATAVQRGTVEYGFEHPGDPTTPGFASLPSLPLSKRVPPESNPDVPRIPVTPLSAHDAQPILEHLDGQASPRGWQGALPFTYHVGPGPVRVKLHLKQEYAYRSIWNVIGKIPGMQYPNEWVIAGNHRDAWVYGAVDPVSGTIAMLETVHGIGELLKAGWRPKRTVIIASWDAEEQGLIGSTEWAEEHEAELQNAVAYFNTDLGAYGPNFRASATPSLKRFVRDVTRSVPNPKGGTLYDSWSGSGHMNSPATSGGYDVALGDLGSGSDYTVFIDHLGIPSTDVRSTGDYGVYHSAFDNYDWFRRFGDTDFLYSQELSRVFGLEILRMAEADVLPYDYESYGNEITSDLKISERSCHDAFGEQSPSFSEVEAAAARFTQAARALAMQAPVGKKATQLNHILMQTERSLLLTNGLPRRPWFKHAIFAPSELRVYSAAVLPGITEAIDRHDLELTRIQIGELTNALNRAAQTMESYQPR